MQRLAGNRAQDLIRPVWFPFEGIEQGRRRRTGYEEVKAEAEAAIARARTALVAQRARAKSPDPRRN
jgi:hypothetical protein